MIFLIEESEIPKAVLSQMSCVEFREFPIVDYADCFCVCNFSEFFCNEETEDVWSFKSSPHMLTLVV